MTLLYLTPIDAETQLAQGIDRPCPVAIADKVRFSELDLLNHVNNKAYLGWFESTRVTYFDTHCARHFSGGPMPRTVMRNSNVHYLKEMLLGESYISTARVLSFRNTSYVMEQQIWSGDLRTRLEAVMVPRTADGSAGQPIPDSLKRQFLDLDGATDLSQ